MGLCGHHSNPSRSLKTLLSGPPGVAESPLNDVACARIASGGITPRDVRAKHPRQGRIINAIARVLGERGEPVRAHAVHAEVEALLGVPVRWSTVKATLGGGWRRSPDASRYHSATVMV
jgi:hypothetical protein